MTYTPTKEELEEMGFEKYYPSRPDTYYIFKCINRSEEYVFQIEFQSEFVLWGAKNAPFKFYPTSKQDIETLIRLFTK